MFKTIVLLFSLIFALGCGRRESDRRITDTAINQHGIDPRLQPYVTSFELAFGVKIGSTPVVISDKYTKEAGSAAICVTWRRGGELVASTINIDPTFFEQIKDFPEAIEQVVWHEALHCLLNLDHNNATKMTNGTYCNMADEEYGCEGGFPISIMRWFAFNPEELKYYADHKQDYINNIKEMQNVL